VYLANAASDDIRDLGLTKARATATIAMTTATLYDLPADFHSYIPNTAYANARVDGFDLPTDEQTWAFLSASGAGDAVYRARFIGGQLEILNPVDGVSLTLEYVSAYPWEDSEGTAKPLATADTDVWRLDDRLMKMAVKWRWKKEKGLEDWQQDAALYQRYVNTLRGRQGAKALLFGEPGFFDPAPYTNLWVA
jgi:hypothetical protein